MANQPLIDPDKIKAPLKRVTDTDAEASTMRYHLQYTDKVDMQTIRLPKRLLDKARDIMLKRTNYSIHITNQKLVEYALLNLFSPAFQNSMRHQLDVTRGFSSLSSMLASNEDPKLEAPRLIDSKLQQIKDKQAQQDILLEALLNAVAWNTADKQGLDRMPVAHDSDEMYAKLRQDDLKPFIDMLLRAGYDEDDRQKHLNNL